MRTPTDSIHVIINPVSWQFEAIERGETVGILTYEQGLRHFDLQETFVPREQRGRGIASRLVAAAVEAIRSSGATTTASCSFVSAYVRDHPGYEDVTTCRPCRPRLALAGEPPELAPITSQSLIDVVDVQVDRVLSDRLVLRPWTLADTEGALAVYGDYAVTRWTRPFIERVGDLRSMRRLISSWISESKSRPHPEGRWAIELIDTGALVGGAALLDTTMLGTTRLTMSCELTPRAVEHGLAAEAGHALLHYSFRLSAIPAVHAHVHVENERGVATLERIGMARAPAAQQCRGSELYLYSIERDDLERGGSPTLARVDSCD